ncbi:UNVERIFIED_CONTAM: hypothetical protein GTU68_012936 [Idotea baltica]|nr:hypothetical protein [Idotea baltica]
MDSETIMRLGRAAAHVFGKKGRRSRVVIGKDTRLSGYMLETALETGIASMGVDVLLVGPLPTPGVAFMTLSMRADAGIMISASHNPYEDNGIKFFGADGFKLADQTEDEIERLMKPGHLDGMRAAPDRIGKMYRIDDATGRYVVYLKSCLDKSTKFDGMKLVLDLSNGAGYRVAPTLLRELGAEVETIGDKPDGKNINLDCGSTHPEKISQKVRETGAFCGIAFDGDADRVIFCDENGDIVDGDLILAICALELKKQGKLVGDTLVGTVMSNLGLENALQKQGIALVRSDVGDRHVLAEMMSRGLYLGGEQSGHVIFLEHNTTGDGILTAIMLLEVLQKSQKPLSYYQKLLERYPQLLINIPVRAKPAFETIPAVSKALADVEAELGSIGRVLLRYSGTEKKARVMVECEDSALCKKTAEYLASVVEEEIGLNSASK